MFVTSLYIALLGIMFFVLSAMVIRQRRKLLVPLGDGGDEMLLRLSRIHGNFTEIVPLALLLMIALEFQYDTNPVIMHICGTVLVISRLAHAQGLLKSKGTSLGRMVGTLSAFLLILGMAVALVILYGISLAG